MSETAQEIFYLLSFSVTTGFFLSKTLFALFKTWQDDSWLEKGRGRRSKP
jgi:hypothetical protein